MVSRLSVIRSTGGEKSHSVVRGGFGVRPRISSPVLAFLLSTHHARNGRFPDLLICSSCNCLLFQLWLRYPEDEMNAIRQPRRFLPMCVVAEFDPEKILALCG